MDYYTLNIQIFHNGELSSSIDRIYLSQRYIIRIIDLNIIINNNQRISFNSL